MNYDKRTGWQVGDKFFSNKWLAIRYAIHNPQYPYKAYLRDESWEATDWGTEPKDSIIDLESKHCEHLRKKYDTLVLCYSGGVDSNTVLQRFIDNQIKIDYICVWYTKDKDAHYNKDVQLAIQHLQANKDKLLGAEILFAEKLDHNEGNSIYNFQHNIINTNWQLRFHHIGHELNLKTRYPDVYRKVLQNGCIITGSNKPYVYNDKKGFYMQHVDYDDENWGQPLLEMFWQGEDPTLQIKQCHLAKQWLIKNNMTDTNKIYKSENTDTFWNLNSSFGRQSMDKFFYTKNCFGETVEDKYFSQHYNSTWGNSYFANHFANWRQTDSYDNLAQVVNYLNQHPKFVEQYKVHGWLTNKRYLG